MKSVVENDTLSIAGSGRDVHVKGLSSLQVLSPVVGACIRPQCCRLCEGCHFDICQIGSMFHDVDVSRHNEIAVDGTLWQYYRVQSPVLNYIHFKGTSKSGEAGADDALCETL